METSTHSSLDDEGELEGRLADLLRRATAGDVAAFEAFYLATVRLVLPIARQICGEAHCDDALSDAYFQAWTTLSTFDPERGRALAWIKVITRSRARDRMRAERVRHGGAEGAVEYDADQLPAESAGPDEILQGAQASTQLRAALAQLPERHRLLVGMAYFRDCTYGEISEVTGLPVGTIKTIMRDSYARLHTLLAPHGRQPFHP